MVGWRWNEVVFEVSIREGKAEEVRSPDFGITMDRVGVSTEGPVTVAFFGLL